jgi:hypothetical protein
MLIISFFYTMTIVNLPTVLLSGSVELSGNGFAPNQILFHDNIDNGTSEINWESLYPAPNPPILNTLQQGNIAMGNSDTYWGIYYSMLNRTSQQTSTISIMDYQKDLDPTVVNPNGVLTFYCTNIKYPNLPQMSSSGAPEFVLAQDFDGVCKWWSLSSVSSIQNAKKIENLPEKSHTWLNNIQLHAYENQQGKQELGPFMEDFEKIDESLVTRTKKDNSNKIISINKDAVLWALVQDYQERNSKK